MSLLNSHMEEGERRGLKTGSEPRDVRQLGVLRPRVVGRSDVQVRFKFRC